MKRLACLVVLTALSAPACARDSYSFTVQGHRIHIEADRHCRSLSCLSVSIPGVGRWHDRRDRGDDVVPVHDPVPAAAPPPAQAAPAPVVAPPMPRVAPAPPVIQAQPAPPAVPVQSAPFAAPVASVVTPAPAVPAPAANNPVIETTGATPEMLPSVGLNAEPRDTPAVETPAPIPPSPPAVTRVSQDTEAPAADSPLGDWQTEGKESTLVHIEACGPALCGYVLDASTGTTGESVLVNMKPKGHSEWSGNVYSRSSGNSYYGTMAMKQADTLRVEACALGPFLCSGNNWRRVQPKPSDVAASQHATPDPRS